MLIMWSEFFELLPMDNRDLSKNKKNLLNSGNGCLYTDLDDITYG